MLRSHWLRFRLRPAPISVLALVVLGALGSLPGQSPDELNFLRGLPDSQSYRGMLASYLNSRAAEALAERRGAVSRLSSASDVAGRKRYVRERMIEALGGLPERTPLNARVVGVIEQDDYRIEKVIFESQPRFYVTANLYLPKRGQPPFPGVLFPLGHEAGAKANPVWQQILVSLARRGYVALAWDTVGQGERVQLYDEDFRESKVVRSTTEHTVLGIQCLLVGDSLARYTIWDGLRALDYLLSRKEVDSSRIGCTGNSGGGTHTAYLSALDDRIHVAAPSCYITSWQRLLETIGPQDAEQCLPPWLGDGLDHADFIYAFAPKPFLILSAIRDFFSIRGARETFEETRRVYTALGAPEKLAMVEADDGHGYSKPRRLAAYRWFERWLRGSEDNQQEPEALVATDEELNCTDSGQVSRSLGGETVTSLNQKRLAEVGRRAPASIDEVRRMVRFEARKAASEPRSFGRIERAGYRIEKLVYESEPGILIPSLLFVPEAPPGRKPAAIFVHGQGKAGGRAEIEDLVQAGLVVLSIDVRGLGETRTATENNGSDWPRYFGDFENAMTALLLGKPLVAMRAEDVSRGVDLLAGRAEVDPEKIYGFGREAGAVPLLYAAAFDPRIRKVALERMLLSYESVVTHRIHRQVFEGIVRGALRQYDFADLVAGLAPRPVWLVDPVDPLGQLAALAEANKHYARSLEAFRRAGAEKELRILRRKPSDTPQTLYRDMLQRGGNTG